MLNPEQISRYPEVHQTNKFLDENIVKIRARVQLLQMTEQRNLMKVTAFQEEGSKHGDQDQTGLLVQVQPPSEGAVAPEIP